MRIFNPMNQVGEKLVTQTAFAKSSLKLEKALAPDGTVTITSADIKDIKDWELSSANVIIGTSQMAFMPDCMRNANGSLTIVFRDQGEYLDFSFVSIVLKRTDNDSIPVEMEVTIEMKINRQMAKTLDAVGKPGYNAAANIAEWQALGQEAFETAQRKYKYANETSFPDDFEAGPVVDDCLISIEGLTEEGIPVADGVTSMVWVSDLPSLTTSNGNSVFNPGPVNLEWCGRMPNLTDATGMFEGCSGLTSWNVDLPASLSNATDMFHGCTGLTSWNVDLPSGLTSASGMFQDCSGLTSWNVDLPANLTNAESMFYDCTGLTEWTIDLPSSITNASGMFIYCTGLTSWNVDLPANLTNAESMFYNCSGLTSFTGELPASLLDASWMFYNCTGLTEWTIDLPSSTTNASGMFNYCTGLTSWNVELPANLTNADYMFQFCTGLTSFTVGLPASLTNAFSMFEGCKLDYASVEKIATTIPIKSGDKGDITIGVASADYASAKAAFNTMITNKNWTVTWQSNY